ncbi:hypothetical protein [Bacillus cereus group sp. N21]|uniref:hypothetical protein n=1 Tax=Bacillus cereus group sp. N21 TaxID=2794591 RepID=UPI0018F557E9|nr:hypothetical protein [Bacillus cereus group sp. N21]MBJ8027258.1 hypothetical protein [Bacillus cereus group sp. N21]
MKEIYYYAGFLFGVLLGLLTVYLIYDTTGFAFIRDLASELDSWMKASVDWLAGLV